MTEAQQALIDHLKWQVTRVALGYADPRCVQKTIQKHMRRAKRRLDSRQVRVLRLMLADCFAFSHQFAFALKHYRAVLRAEPDCVKAMTGIAPLCRNLEHTLEWLDTALATAERQEDCQAQLDVLDMMLTFGPTDRVSAVLAQMQKLVEIAPHLEQYHLHTLACLPVEGDLGFQIKTYLESILRRNILCDADCRWYGVTMARLAEMYNKLGLTAAETRSRLGQFRSLCRDEHSAAYFDHTLGRRFDGDQYRVLGRIDQLPGQQAGVRDTRRDTNC